MAAITANIGAQTAPMLTPNAPATIDKLANRVIPVPINTNSGPNAANNPATTITNV